MIHAATNRAAELVQIDARLRLAIDKKEGTGPFPSL